MDVHGFARRWGDAALAAALATGITTELAAWAHDRLALSVAIGLLMTIPVCLRRTSPLLAFLLSMTGLQLMGEVQPGFDNDSMFFVLTFFVTIYSVGRHATGPEAWLGAVGVAAAMGLFVESESGLGNADLGDLAFVLAFVGAPWAAGLALRLRQERERELTAENGRIRREQEERTRRAIAEERATIARELHDVVAHAISVTVLQARGARRKLGRDEAEVRRALDAIEHTNTQALGDMRRLLALLRDTEGDAATAPQPSLARLDDLVADVGGSGLPVTVEATGDGRDVPPGVDLSAYRIIQEALTNVLKHAGPATATVRIEYGADDLRLAVTDTGGGADAPAGGSGHGLVGIRERVAVVGGEVEAGPAPGGGFEVRARLPYSVDA